MAKGNAVIATIVADIRSEAGQVPGAIEFREIDGIVRGIAARCPCGCGHEMWMPVRAEKSPRTDRPEWEWNGSRDKATLQPSVLNSGLPCKWHGYLGSSDKSRPGVWVEV